MSEETPISRVIKLPASSPIASVVKLEGGVVTTGGAGLWTGEGPPPDMIPGAEVGDEYLDMVTGTLYELKPGV